MADHGSFSRILLATDGTPDAEAAVAATIALAAYSESRVWVLHVWNLDIHRRHGHWDVETRSDAEKLVRRAVDRLTNAGVEAFEAIDSADGAHVASSIAVAAREYRADLVVMGSRGLSDWQSIFRHSVSHQVLALLDCPVLVVRDHGARGVVGRTRRIVVAVAGGDDIKAATDAAIAVAQTVNVEALVVHVTQAMFGAQGFAYVESDEDVAACVSDAVKRLSDAGIPTEKMVLQTGPVARSLVEAAAGWNADMIVMGSSRMGSVGGLMFGSVSHELLHSADLPVLIAGRVKP